MLLAIIALAGCQKKEKSDNPFFNEYGTPFDVPPFEKIKAAHYMPAYLRGIEEERRDIKTIINNPAEPTFENTIKALEYSGELLTKVSSVFGALNSANTNDTLQKINRELSPLLSKQRDDINLNDTLFRRVKSVYENKEKFKLTEEEKKLLEDTYKSFVRSGADLSAEDKAKLRKINEETSLLSVKFGQNLLAETNAFLLIIDKKEDLSGLPEGAVIQAAATAKNLKMDGKWVFTIQYPIMEQFLKYSDKRELRKKIFTAYFMKGDNDNENDNKVIIARIAKLRVERSHLLGYKSYADFALERNMAKTPAKVFEFLNEVWTAATPVAKAEALAQQEMIKKEGGNFKLEPWDWWYYTEKIRQEKYNLNDELTRPYFKIDNVMQGMFYVANQLYGLEFTKRTDIPKYHPDVETFEVKRSGNHVGVLMIDNYPRNSKRSGAWCGAYRGQSHDKDGKMIYPIVTMVTNSTPPTADKPALLTPDEASTLFHEFGHALHQLVSNSTYPGISGTSVPRDFVELPSQIMEHWVLEPEVLKVYAKHYQTGEVIPADIVEKLGVGIKQIQYGIHNSGIPGSCFAGYGIPFTYRTN